MKKPYFFGFKQVDKDAKEKLVQIVNMLMGLLKGLGYEFESGTAVVRDEAHFSFSFEQEKE